MEPKHVKNPPPLEKSETQEDLQRYLQAGRQLASPSPGEEVVITGIAGRFADANDVYDYRHNLFNQVSMVSKDNRRWKPNHPEIPHPSGKINFLEKFDAGFFGIHYRQAQQMDPQARQLLERSYEAVLDAGVHPDELKGSRTGVYIGATYSETEKIWLFDRLESPSYAATGVNRSTIAHWISYCMGLEGRSYIASTACSTSANVLNDAYIDIRSGRCENALVGATTLLLHPMMTLHLYRLGVLSLDGECKSFDERANGYVRSEGIAVIFLQKVENARRIYSQIYHVKTNCDGFKPEGFQHPSGVMQQKLINDVYKECNITPEDLDYFEAHATGTHVGDYIETNSIDKAICSKRRTPLNVGCTKSLLGHTEATSAISSIVKIIFGMENNCLLPNGNYLHPRKALKGIHEGRMVVVTKLTPWPENGKGFAAVSSFGIGGTNGHILLKRFAKRKSDYGKPMDDLFRLICVSGRTAHSVTHILNDVKQRVLDEEFVRMLHEVFKNNTVGHLYRGYSIMSKMGEKSRSIAKHDGRKRPICLLLGGSSNNLENLGKYLIKYPLFERTIDKIDAILSPKEVNIRKIIEQESATDPENSITRTVVIQVALIDILRKLEVSTNFIISCGVGEVAAAYADGVLTLEQTILAAYYIGCYLQSLGKPILTSYQVETDYKELQTIRPNDLEVTQNMIMGVSESVKQFVKGLEDKGVKTREVQNASVCCKYSEHTHLKLLQQLQELIPKPKQRLSTLAKNKISPEHLLKEIQTPSLIQEALCTLPFNSVILAIDPQAAKVSDFTTINLTITGNSTSNNDDLFLDRLGRLYELGYNLKLEKLYPEVKWPVAANTPMISPLIKWNHTEDWFVPRYEVQEKLKYGKRTAIVNLEQPEWAFMAGHIIDDRNIIPAMGYLSLVWETLAMVLDERMSDMGVVFEDVKFLRNTNIPANENVRLTIMVHKITGKFVIEEQEQQLVTGKIYIADDLLQMVETSSETSSQQLTTEDIYNELQLRGYGYKGAFRALKGCNLDKLNGLLEWKGNWIAFVDNMLQLELLREKTRNLYVPTGIDRLAIDAKTHIRYAKEMVNDSVLPVYVYKESGTIKSGGIEIRGVSTHSIPQSKPTAEPLLESYKLIPNEARLSTAQSIRVNIQIILENIHDAGLRIVELADEDNRGLLSPAIYQVLGHYPMIQHEIVVLSDEVLELSDIATEKRKLCTEVNTCSLVIISNGLSRSKIMEGALHALKSDGFVLTRGNLYRNPDLNMVSIHKTETETFVLFRKCIKMVTPVVIDISKHATLDYLHTLRAASESNQQIVVFAQNSSSNGLLGLADSLQTGRSNIQFFLILDEAPKFDISNKFYFGQYQKKLYINVFSGGKWGTYRHLLVEKGTLVQCQHIFGDLSTLSWTEGPFICKSDTIQVYYSALGANTKDRPEQLNTTLGVEFSGRDAAGRRVMGLVNHGALASVVTADSDLTWDVPNEWLMEDAATVPAAYAAVVYGLIMISKIKPNQSILIHEGANDTGQAAINIALYYKCRIFVTVRNEEERSFIQKQFPEIPANQIGSSISTSFEQMICRETYKNGVEVVLNTLQDEKLEASVRCLAPYGKILNLVQVAVPQLNKGRSFCGISTQALIKGPVFIKQAVKDLIINGLKVGFIKPLTKTIFKHDEVEQAFRYMAAHKHIGKYIINLREEEPQRLMVPDKMLYMGLPRFYCDCDCSYVVFGELDHFSLELTDWLIQRGAKKLLMVVKTGLTTGYQTLRMRKWNSNQVTTRLSTADATTKKGCNAIINAATKLGSIAGIFITGNIPTENLITTQNLDSVGRNKCPMLQHFVVFLSSSNELSDVDQINRGFTNSSMERVCEQRKKDGYPALAIRWGAIEEIGAITENHGNNSILKQKIASCLNVLDTFLKQDEPVVSSKVLAKTERKQRKSQNIINVIRKLIGLKDLKTISTQTKLSEFGMDSILAVEVKQILEKEFQVTFTANDIINISFQRIQELSDTKTAEK